MPASPAPPAARQHPAPAGRGRLEPDRRHAGQAREVPRRRQPRLAPEEIIDEARNGRMFILVDDEDRENEGDLVIPAQMATPDAINFMATHGRGLICLALTKERVEQLGLGLMSRNNGTRHETAFTISIEAREGVTTGISAADRARTISVAIDAAKGPRTHRHPRPCLSAGRARRRRAGPRRPYRGGGRRLAARRAQSVGRDLRDHARGRHDGADGRSGRLRPAPRPQDRHDPRPDRLSPAARTIWSSRSPRRGSTAAGAANGPRSPSSTRPRAPRRSRWSRARSIRPSRRWCGCTRSACSPTCSPRPARAAGCSKARCR